MEGEKLMNNSLDLPFFEINDTPITDILRSRKSNKHNNYQIESFNLIEWKIKNTISN